MPGPIPPGDTSPITAATGTARGGNPPGPVRNSTLRTPAGRPAPEPLDASRPADNQIEVEWQFDALDLRPVERWLAALPGRRSATGDIVTAVAKPTRRLVDRYLDSDDWRVGRAGFVLRTRRRGGRDEATLKDTKPAGPGGLRQRLEVTEALTSAGIEHLGTDGPVGRRVAAVAGRRPLHPVLEVRTRRRPFSLRVGGTEVAEVAVDETTIAVGQGQRPVQLRRVEVEVVPSWVPRLEPLVEDLRTACGLQPATLSKFEAGLMALGLAIPGPPDLGSSESGPTSTFAELGYAVVRRQLGVLLAREAGTRLGEDIEELHDMRVATRRLRAALDLFADVFPVRAPALRDELRWLAGVLGAVRDLDVQLERMDETEEWHVGGVGAGSPLDHLRHLLQQERQGLQASLLADLDSPRYERLVAGLVAMAQRGPVRRTAASRLPAVVAVPDLVLARHLAVARAAKRARRTGVAADYHRLRIRAKRLRYSLEFTAPLYETRTERFVRQLARLQDSLGLMQDAEVATTRLLALATGEGAALPAATVFAMGSVAERYRFEAARLLAGMASQLKVLRGREWEELSELMAARKSEAQAALLPAPSARVLPVAAAPSPGSTEAGLPSAVARSGRPGSEEEQPGAANGHALDQELVNGPPTG